MIGIGVKDVSSRLINAYFQNLLGFRKEETILLRNEYFRRYGLIVEGLVSNYQVDPLEFNSMVDDALPFDSLIRPNPELRQLLEETDKENFRLSLLSHVYITHVKRVARLLGVEDLFEGAIYCDYSKEPLVCKPQSAMFETAMRVAGVKRCSDCYLIDDSYRNCQGAESFGWTAVHLVEKGIAKELVFRHQIRSLEELREISPGWFKGQANR
ncbi:pyrimidine 5 nucleotidase [Fusarium sp. NRRL 25303]|nr:pyrimidine 5 nucleotidase [Fusarium sp. NRRL 25303]